MRAQGQFLDFAWSVPASNFRRTNMFGASARLRIQEGILVREIVKPAFRNDLDDWQGLFAQNPNGQFTSGDEFLDQSSRSYLAASAIAESTSRSLLMI